MPEERPEFNEILLSLEDMKRDPAFQRHRSVPNTPAQLSLNAQQHMAKSQGDSPHSSTTSSADKIDDKSAQSLQDRLHSSSSDDSDSESDQPPPKEKITSGYVD